MTAHHCGLNSAGHVAQFDSSRTDATTEPPPGVMSVTAINLLPRGAPIGRNLRRLGYCSERCRATMAADIACNPQTYSRASGNTIMSVWLCTSQQYSQHALHTVGCGTQSMYIWHNAPQSNLNPQKTPIPNNAATVSTMRGIPLSAVALGQYCP